LRELARHKQAGNRTHPSYYFAYCFLGLAGLGLIGLVLEGVGTKLDILKRQTLLGDLAAKLHAAPVVYENNLYAVASKIPLSLAITIVCGGIGYYLLKHATNANLKSLGLTDLEVTELHKHWDKKELENKKAVEK